MTAGETPFAVTFFRDYAARTKQQKQLTLAQLEGLICDASAPGKSALPWLKLARFGETRTTKGSLRWDRNVIAVTGIEGDYDGEQISFEDACNMVRRAGLLAIVYTSPSYTPTAPRWRVLCPLSRECPPERRARIVDRLNGVLKGALHVESWTLSQGFYYGSVNHNPDHQVELIDGEPIDELDELDLVAIGRPGTKPATNGGGGQSFGPVDEKALLEEIRSGASYHTAAMRLIGSWALHGMPMLEARERITSAFEDVFPGDRDARWQARMNDIPRMLKDVYGKEAWKRDEGTARAPNGTNGIDADNDRAPIICTTPVRRRIADIPPRAWAYGNFLLFGEAAAIGAVDGGGKGAMAAAIALSMITGKGLLGERVWRKGRVIVITYEDDEEEWSRRIAAACLHYKLDYETVIDGFRFMSRPGGRVSFASPSVRGGPVLFPDSEEIIRHVKGVGDAALMITDPFNHCHELDDGNSNALVAMVAREHTRIARACMIPDLVLHHLRKGATGTADDLMGAVMLRATFRACRILQRMTEDEAKRLELPPDQAWRYSRISASKENYAPPPERSTWYRFESVALGNPSELYPEGDNVQVTTIWSPPSPFKGISLGTIKAIFDEIRAGTGDEQFYSPDRRAKQWAGDVIVKHTGKAAEVAVSMLKSWLDTRVLIQDTAKSPINRAQKARVVLNEAKVADVLEPLGRWEAAE